MRVAFFQRFFAHYQWGLVQELSEHAEHQYDFYGATTDPGHTGILPLSAEQRSLIRFHAVRTWQPNRYVALQPAAVRSGLLDTYDAFILEGSFQHPTAWLTMLAAQARGKRVLLYSHGWRRPDHHRVVKLFRLAFMRRADAALLYGHRAKGIGMSLGIAGERLHVVFNSLDWRKMVRLREAVTEETRREVIREAFGDPHLPMVVFSGRLAAAKRIDLLLAACGCLVRDGVRHGLLIIGAGPEANRLQALARRLDVAVHFTGALHDEWELCRLISAASVAAVPSAIGLSGIHALTYGTPVVTDDDWDSHGPESEAIIPERTGLFFKAGDPESLAHALKRFLLDPSARRAYAPRCMQVIDHCYNPVYMRQVFDRAVSGAPAVDVKIETILDGLASPAGGVD